MDISLPKDLMEIIEQLIIYEDMLKREEMDEFQYEYAYIEAPMFYQEEDEDDKEDWKIEISM